MATKAALNKKVAEVESEIPDITNSTNLATKAALNSEDTVDIITTFIAIYYFIIITTTLDARIKEALKSLARKK